MNNDNESENNETLLAICFQVTTSERLIGAAFINLHERKMQITEFSDNEHFSGLESLIIQQNNSSVDSKFKVLVQVPNELIKEKITDTLQMCEANFEISSNKKDWAYKEVSVSLDQLLKTQFEYMIEESKMELALSALNAAIETMKLKSYGEGVKRSFVLSKYTLNNYLRLDVAAMKALNVFPGSSGSVDVGGASGQAGSLYGLLNQCKTQIGARLLKKWLKQPTSELEEIQSRLEIVDYLNKNESLRNDIQQMLRTFPDLEKLYSKFYRVQAKMRNNAQLVDCVKVYNMICTLQELVRHLDNNCIDEQSELRIQIIDPLKANIDDFAKLRQMLEECIDIGKARQNDYIINPNFSPELQKIDQSLQDVKKNMEKLRKAVDDDLKVNKAVTLVESALHTFIFECLKTEGDSGMRSSKQTYRIIGTKNRIMSFTCQGLKDLVSKFSDLDEQYKQQQEELVVKVLEIASTYFPLLENVSMLISKLDVLAAFAQVSSNQQYSKPEMMRDRTMRLFESRHPLIYFQDPSACISNDCSLIPDQSSVNIITGPNMGGKSTFIRQVAICILFAHIGCFVPASKSQIPVIDCIIARVGASDHQVRGISTFMAEMLEASCMMETATKNSFVIMDELGRGTSTNEGFGIAWAIAQYLATEIDCLCLFATHFHEMTAMEKEFKNVKNLYVSALADGDKLTMLYKVQQGVIDRSYGIHVAEMLKFPEEVLKQAREMAAKLEDFNNEQ